MLKSLILDFQQTKNAPFPTKYIVTSCDINRWNMAWRAIDASKLFNTGPLFQGYEPLVVKRCSDWTGGDWATGEFQSVPIVAGFSIAAIIYGGLHALAWSAHFKSYIERLLWQISACVVMGGIPVGLILLRTTIYTKARRNEVLYQASSLLSLILYFMVLTVYVLARGYLVVQCFINLFHLPASVYDVPDWSTWFPHIS